MTDRVVLRLDGLLPERLLNRAQDEGACIERAERLSPRSIRLTCGRASAAVVKHLAEQYHLPCREERAGGISAFLRAIRAHPTLPAAFLVFFALTALFLSRIWAVEVLTPDGMPVPADASAILREAGVYPGAPARDADLGRAADSLKALDGCAYASVSRKGVRVVVSLRGETPRPELYELSRPRDLVALRDGVVLSVNVKSGKAMVAPGDLVRKGQLLISGSERAGKDETVGVGALGSVTARVWCVGEASDCVRENRKDYTGRVSAATQLVLPFCSLPLSEGETYARCETRTREIPIGGLFLPLKLVREERYEYRNTPVDRDAGALMEVLGARSEAEAEADRAEKGLTQDEIIDKWTNYSMIDQDTLHARTVLELESEIAVTRGYLEGT